MEMPKLITDEMLEEWAIVATYDDLVAKIIKRCRGLVHDAAVRDSGGAHEG
jgi:hypothetical protein